MLKLSYSDAESREPKKWESTISSTSTRSNQETQFLNLQITARKAPDLCLMNPATIKERKRRFPFFLPLSVCLSACHKNRMALTSVKSTLVPNVTETWPGARGLG